MANHCGNCARLTGRFVDHGTSLWLELGDAGHVEIPNKAGEVHGRGAGYVDVALAAEVRYESQVAFLQGPIARTLVGRVESIFDPKVGTVRPSLRPDHMAPERPTS